MFILLGRIFRRISAWMLRGRFWLENRDFGASAAAIGIVFRDLSVPINPGTRNRLLSNIQSATWCCERGYTIPAWQSGAAAKGCPTRPTRGVLLLLLLLPGEVPFTIRFKEMPEDITPITWLHPTQKHLKACENVTRCTVLSSALANQRRGHSEIDGDIHLALSKNQGPGAGLPSPPSTILYPGEKMSQAAPP